MHQEGLKKRVWQRDGDESKTDAHFGADVNYLIQTDTQNAASGIHVLSTTRLHIDGE